MNNSLGWENVKQCIAIRCFLIEDFEKGIFGRKTFYGSNMFLFWWICDCLNHTKPLNCLILWATVTQASPMWKSFFIWLNHIGYATADLPGKTFLGHKRALGWGLDFKNICILGAWHLYGEQARSWDTIWLRQESGSSQGVPRHKLTLFFLSCFQIHSSFHGMDVFALCKHPSFPPCSAL